MKKSFYFLLAMLCVSIVLNVWQCSNELEPSEVIERDTVWKDTVIHEPAPAETVNTGRVVYIKVPTPGRTDTLTVHDSIDVPIPILLKIYYDSLYTAWVSGYDANLDSIDLRLPTITETITKTIVKPSPRLSIGIQAGAGVGVFSRQPDVYIGIGAQWLLWPK